jgi:hypothetical protein
MNVDAANKGSFRTLDAAEITKTLARLQQRINERFPSAGLTAVCVELVEISRSTAARAEQISKPHSVLRTISAAVILTGLAVLAYVASIIEYKHGADNLFGVLQGIEASFNVVLLIGGAIFFLSTIETRWKRQQALGNPHELRSVIHVIDMHQLTKDPSTPMSASRRTKSSPQHNLTPFELVRYLDYCSEMLSLTAKLAVLYAQSSRDNTVNNAVTEIEQISANLSAKIWQKITLIQSREDWDVAPPSTSEKT